MHFLYAVNNITVTITDDALCSAYVIRGVQKLYEHKLASIN